MLPSPKRRDLALKIIQYSVRLVGSTNVTKGKHVPRMNQCRPMSGCITKTVGLDRGVTSSIIGIRRRIHPRTLDMGWNFIFSARRMSLGFYLIPLLC
jgi:hypothetical protein